MNVPPSADVPAAPLRKPLNSRQRRVLGVLIEKAKTTPAAYPLTLNGIVVGCNQKNNREPVMTLAADEVERVLDELRTLGAVTEAEGSGRVTKYRHEVYAWLAVSKAEAAVLSELLLRGDQTLGALRGRADRMEPFADLAALKPVVDTLVRRGLLIELSARGRGQVVSHNLYEERELAELRARYRGHVAPANSFDDGASTTRSAARPAAEGRSPAPLADATIEAPNKLEDRLATLRGEVADLGAEVARLGERVRELESRLTAGEG